jgi:hypothetical protein
MNLFKKCTKNNENIENTYKIHKSIKNYHFNFGLR